MENGTTFWFVRTGEADLIMVSKDDRQTAADKTAAVETPIGGAPLAWGAENCGPSGEKPADYALGRLRENLARVIRGKDSGVEILMTALLAGGSVLMEDVPGVGKTTLAKALALSVDSCFSRVQFTPDLLPGDILGSSVYNPIQGNFTFRSGPIFCNILLADEINRASPRTQSALLEAMSEGQATIEGEKHTLPHPFMVIATQNPIEFHGTYPLPEAQLDRFMVTLRLGYPAPEVERTILFDHASGEPVDSVDPVMTGAEVIALQGRVRRVHVETALADYMVAIVTETRRHTDIKLGASPRGALMLFRAVQALALIRGRDHASPDDVKEMAPHVLPHRLVLTPKAKYAGVTRESAVAEILAGVKAPV